MRNKGKNQSGFSERVCEPFDHEIASNRLSKMWKEITKKDASNFAVIALLTIIAVLVGYILLTRNQPPAPTYVTNETKNINVTKNITDNSTAKYATIYNPITNTQINVRQWGDLELAEREAIREEAVRKFPEIKNTDKRDMRPVAKWLVEEKGVITPSVRDVFRN